MYYCVIVNTGGFGCGIYIKNLSVLRMAGCSITGAYYSGLQAIDSEVCVMHSKVHSPISLLYFNVYIF